jgi:hypothetical protein
MQCLQNTTTLIKDGRKPEEPRPASSKKNIWRIYRYDRYLTKKDTAVYAKKK